MKINVSPLFGQKAVQIAQFEENGAPGPVIFDKTRGELFIGAVSKGAARDELLTQLHAADIAPNALRFERNLIITADPMVAEMIEVSSCEAGFQVIKNLEALNPPERQIMTLEEGWDLVAAMLVKGTLNLDEAYVAFRGLYLAHCPLASLEQLIDMASDADRRHHAGIAQIDACR